MLTSRDIKINIKKGITLSITVVSCLVSFAQKEGKNLVPNPGFEKHKNKSNEITNAAPWKNAGTVDYYMKPEKIDTSKYKGAHTGTCYAGLRFQGEYKEYLYVALTAPLERNSTYHFRMYVRLLAESTVTVKQLGVYFSDKEFKAGMIFDQEGIIDSTYSKGISGTFNWIPIQGNYVAHGGEKYIIIGNFSINTKEDMVRKNKWDIFEFKEAYYFIDDISLRKKLSTTDSLNKKMALVNLLPVLPDSFETGQTFELKNIQFDNGSAKLLHDSFFILDEWIKVLNDHPFMEIQINGNTDNQGNEAKNKKLSKDRAKAIYDYFVEQDVINPMTYKGFGSSQPIVANDTEENRKKNQRIELLIIKQ